MAAKNRLTASIVTRDNFGHAQRAEGHQFSLTGQATVKP
jgi:hypothetical protein